MGAIIWIIIFIWVVVALSKGKGQSRNQGSPQKREKELTPEERQRELKARLAKKYSRQTDSGILERAKSSVEEDFGPEEGEFQALKSYNAAAGTAKSREAATGSDKNASYGMSGGFRENGPVVFDRQKLPDNDIMKDIEDLMIKGPDTSIAFERDFVSEGLDLLNRIQV